MNTGKCACVCNYCMYKQCVTCGGSFSDGPCPFLYGRRLEFLGWLNGDDSGKECNADSFADQVCVSFCVSIMTTNSIKLLFYFT